jgi:hypothetical protein
MATIACFRGQFDSMCAELSGRLDSCLPEEAEAGLKCLALANVGLEGSDAERASALEELVRLGEKAESKGLLASGATALLIGQAVSHEISAGEFPGMGNWNQ